MSPAKWTGLDVARWDAYLLSQRPSVRAGAMMRRNEFVQASARPGATIARLGLTVVKSWISISVLWLALMAGATAHAADVLVAVATNFLAAAKVHGKASGDNISFSSASTGLHYAQIKHGAPFDVFLAADQERPRLLVNAGLADSGSRFTYAMGQLVLVTGRTDFPSQNPKVWLAQTRLSAVALANPSLAPYGAAARQVLDAWGLWGKLKGKLVFSQNVGQAYSLVATGNADAGFVARSLLIGLTGAEATSYMAVSTSDHAPIRQDAVLLKRARSRTAARRFLEFLRSPAGRGLIQDYGYLVP